MTVNNQYNLKGVLLMVIFYSMTSFIFSQSEYNIGAQDTVLSCNSDNVILNGSHEFEYISPAVSGITLSLANEDHTAEGFMVTLSDGRIVHFFRYDPGANGSHTGNHARIIKRTSVDNGFSWILYEEVYDDPDYDDRNVHGGLIGQDSIVLFFRRYDAISSGQIDLNYIYSFDGGNTWSERTVINSISNGTCGTNKICKIPGAGFMMSICGQYYIELRFSSDGIDWSYIHKVWNYSSNHLYNFGEACFSYVGNGRIIGLVRDNDQIFNSTYYQILSEDFGQTWSEPQRTNIATPYFCPSPTLFYDEQHEDVWVIATDRRNYSGSGNEFMAHQSRIWVYQTKADSIFNYTAQYHLFTSMLRPFPNYYRLYGYSTYTRKNDGNYLVVFTESYMETNTTEEADFYQFEINYQTMVSESSIYSWNTGEISESLTVDSSGIYKVTCTDNLDHVWSDSVFVSIIKAFIGQEDQYCDPGDTVLISCNVGNVEPGYFFSWSTGETTSSITVAPLSTTKYFVTIENVIFSCTDSLLVHVRTQPANENENKPSSIDSLLSDNEMIIAPNPFFDKTCIYFNNIRPDECDIFIYDFSGRMIRKYDNINSDFLEIERYEMKKGIYFLVLKSVNGKLLSKKLEIL